MGCGGVSECGRQRMGSLSPVPLRTPLNASASTNTSPQHAAVASGYYPLPAIELSERLEKQNCSSPLLGAGLGLQSSAVLRADFGRDERSTAGEEVPRSRS